MNGLSLLIIIIVIAYFYNQRYPQSDTYKMYFGGAVILYFIFIYFMNYQQPFVYKMARNIKDVQTQPLHTIIPDYKLNTVNSNNVKYKVADKQNLKCPSCQNTIVLEEIDYYKLSYITPLEFGGINSPENLKLLCPTCYEFRRY